MDGLCYIYLFLSVIIFIIRWPSLSKKIQQVIWEEEDKKRKEKELG